MNRIERGVARVGEVLQQIFIVIRFRLVLQTVTQLLANTAYRIRHNHSSFPHSNIHMCTPSHITLPHTYVYIAQHVIPLIRISRSSISSTVSILYLISGISKSPDFSCSYRIRHCQLQMADCKLHCEVSCNSDGTVACGGRQAGTI